MTAVTSLRSWARNTVSGLPRSFWLLMLATFVNRAGLFVLPFLTLYLTGQRHFSVESATEVIGFYGVGSFTSQFFGGFLTDRVGRRTTMVISMFITAGLLLILGTLGDIVAIAAITLLIGLFTDLYWPAASAMIADVVPAADQPRAFSLRYWTINLAASVAVSLGGLLAQNNFGLLFIGDALTSVAFGLIILFFVPETHNQAQSTTPQSTDATADTEANPGNNRDRLIFILVFMLLALFSGSVYAQFGVTMPLDMTAKGLTTADYGAAIALNGLLVILASIPINRLLERRSPFAMMAVASLLTGIGFGLYAIAQSWVLFALGVVVWTLGEMVSSPFGPTIMAQVAPQRQRGLYQGLLGAGYGLAAFAGPVLGGLVYDHWGSAALWVGCLALGTIVAVAYAAVLAPQYRRLTTQTPNPPLSADNRPIALSEP
jgi:predicted MFS family arabinose efflux permease